MHEVISNARISPSLDTFHIVKSAILLYYQGTKVSVIPNLSNSSSGLIHLALSDVTNIVCHLKKGSPGSDGLPFWIFRDNCELLAPVVLHICCLSISISTVSGCFKWAFITPIPKCSSPSSKDYLTTKSILLRSTSFYRKPTYTILLCEFQSNLS